MQSPHPSIVVRQMMEGTSHGHGYDNLDLEKKEYRIWIWVSAKQYDHTAHHRTARDHTAHEHGQWSNSDRKLRARSPTEFYTHNNQTTRCH